MRVGSLHRRLDGLSEQLVHELADERPHLLHRLKEDRRQRREQLDKSIMSTWRLEKGWSRFQMTLHILGNRCGCTPAVVPPLSRRGIPTFSFYLWE